MADPLDGVCSVRPCAAGGGRFGMGEPPPVGWIKALVLIASGGRGRGTKSEVTFGRD